LGKAQFSNFSDALDEIAAQARVAIVAEGIPLHPALAEKEIPSVTGQARPLSEVVGSVAAAYDYDVERIGPVCVLVKRYSDSGDVPAVTMGEWTECLRQIVRLTAPFNPHVDFRASRRNPIVGDLAASFTPAQLGALKGGGLRLSALSAAQIALVRRFALYLYVQGSADAVSLALSRLEGVDDTVVFRYADVGVEKHVFGCDIALWGPGRPLSFARLGGAWCGYGLLPVTIPFQAPPGVQDPSDPGDLANRSTVARGSTLEGALTELNARTASTTRVKIDPALETKTVTVAGAENASPEEMAAAMADVYGLCITTRSVRAGTVLRLGFCAAPPVPERAAGLQQAIEAVIPAPLLRALHASEGREAIETALRYAYRTYRCGPPVGEPDGGTGGRDKWEDETLPGLRQAMKDRKIMLNSGRALADFDRASHQAVWLPGKLRMAAMKSLRALVEPHLRASATGRLPFSAVSGQARDAFAFVVASECLTALGQWASTPKKDYIVDFNHQILIGGLYPQPEGHPPNFALFFENQRPDGKVQQGDGIGGVMYVK
jgi:hypothetical protein